MDFHKLTKIEGLKNATLVITIGGILILLVSGLYFLTSGNKPSNNELYILATIFVFTVVFGALAAYYSTVFDRYSAFYSGNLNIGVSRRNLLDTLARDRILAPLQFINLNRNYEIFYKESLLTYLNGFPNASLIITLKCLEVALKEKYRTLKQVTAQSLSSEDQEFISKADKKIQNLIEHKKVQGIDGVDLFNLIECAQVYFKNYKEILQYLRSIRNSIHTQEVTMSTDAQLAISKIGSVLNILFPLPPTLNLSIRCKVCNGMHQYTIDSSKYFIGSVLSLECKDPNIEDKIYSITVPLYLWQ